MAIHATLPATISEGATGENVKWLQYNLVRRTLSDATQIDGIFGPVTKAAVEQFQADEHLVVDGIAGPATWSIRCANAAIRPRSGCGDSTLSSPRSPEPASVRREQ